MVTGFGAEMGIGAVARAEVIAEAGAEATEAAGAGGGGPGAGAGGAGEGTEGVEGARERYRGFRFKETWP